jgi:hypothetical protein
MSLPAAYQADHPDLDYIFQIRKRVPHAFPAPNPNFVCHLNPEKSEASLILDKGLSVDLRKRVNPSFREHWDVSIDDSIKILVQGNEMAIDTCKPNYGLYEVPIMQKTMDKLLDLGFNQ